MKKLLALLLSALMLVSLTCCVADNGESTDPSAEQSPDASQTQESSGAASETSQNEAPSQATSETSPAESSVSETSAIDPSEIKWPVIVGDFIQPGPFEALSDAVLHQHFAYLHEAGIEYLVIGLTAEMSDDYKIVNALFTNDFITANKAPNYSTYCNKMLDRFLPLAEEFGIRCYIATPSISNAIMSAALSDKSVGDKYAALSVEMAQSIYDQYKETYPTALYGWYFTPEIPNIFGRWPKIMFDNCSSVLAELRKGFTGIDPDMPFFLSPYFSNTTGYENAENTAKGWKQILSGVPFTKGDFFCPQDCIGSGLLTLDTYLPYFQALSEALKDETVELWGNPEDFVQANWTSAPITRFAKQLQDLEPYCGGFISFAYSHYYAPTLSGNTRFHEDYLTYRNTGKAPDNGYAEQITVKEFEVTETISGIKLRASAGQCKNFIRSAEFYRDGTLIGNVYAGTETLANDTVQIILEYGEKDSAKHTYTVTFRDFLQNEGEKSIDFTCSGDTGGVISVGCAYTQVYGGMGGYPDDGVKLTDGKFAQVAAYHDKALSGYADIATVDFIIDLGDKKTVTAASVKCLSNGDAGSYAPTGFSVALSLDGETYGDFTRVESADFEEINGFTTMVAMLSATEARYVKFRVGTLVSWFFTDELSVYGK